MRRTASKIYGIRSTPHYLKYRFFEKKLSLWKEYLDNDERRVLQFLAVPPGSLTITSNKANFARRCSESNIPVPMIKCLYSKHGFDKNLGINAFREETEFANHIRSFCDGSYLIKPITGRHGDGIVKFEVCGSNLIDKDGRDTTANQLIEDSCSNPYGDYGLMVQEFVRPHRDLQPIMNGPGLGTIRVVTLRSPDGDACIPWAVIKLPLRDSISDNFSGGETGNLIAAIDVESGRILRAVGKNPERDLLEEVIEHPETHTTLSGYKLPAWRSTLEHVRAATRAFGEFPSLGWDVAISDKGPVVIEMNTYWCCELIQIAYDRGIREEILSHYALYGIDLGQHDEILGYLKTDEGRAAERGL
jgi:hypothetical protein